MEQKEYWNSVAETKIFTTQVQVAELEKYLPKEALILDVGCGYGRTLHELNEAGFVNLMGIDFSEKMIERGKSMYPELDLSVKRTKEIALEKDSVDAVILFAVLTCITGNEEQKALITDIRRVLKPGGILYINDFLLNEDDRNRIRYEQFQKQYSVYGVFELPEGAVLRHHSEVWIKELLGDLKEQEYSRIMHRTMNGHTSNGFYYIGKKS